MVSTLTRLLCSALWKSPCFHLLQIIPSSCMFFQALSATQSSCLKKNIFSRSSFLTFIHTLSVGSAPPPGPFRPSWQRTSFSNFFLYCFPMWLKLFSFTNGGKRFLLYIMPHSVIPEDGIHSRRRNSKPHTGIPLWSFRKFCINPWKPSGNFM